jgi:transcriptional regulator PpsR
MVASREPLKDSLGALDPMDWSKLIVAIADVTLVLDKKGLIRDVALGNEVSPKDGIEAWLGRAWADTVTSESRPKVLEILREATAKSPPRWRHINHLPFSGREEVPVRYCAMSVGRKGQIVAVGQDLRAAARLQQKLIDAQLALEHEFSRLRVAETRYRLLFEISSEAVLVVDAASLKVEDANPAAIGLIGKQVRRIVGRSVTDLFGTDAAPAIYAILTAANTTGTNEDVVEWTAGEAVKCVISASLFRQDGTSHFLIRLTPIFAEGYQSAIPKAKSALLDIVGKLPDGFVLTKSNWQILYANSAFLDMAHLATEEQARALSLERFIGPQGASFSVLTANLREHGSVRNFATTLRSEHGTIEEVEVTAVAVADSNQPCFGFVFRNRGRAPAIHSRSDRPLQRSVSQLTELVGRVPLKDIVRESTDIIERLAITAALELTNDNRASAADMLGVSRQSLYMKMRRHGLGGLDE